MKYPYCYIYFLIFSTYLFLCFSKEGVAQNYILITHPNKNKVEIINNNTKILYMTDSRGNVKRGNLHDLGDSTIVVDELVIDIEDLYMIGQPTTAKTVMAFVVAPIFIAGTIQVLFSRIFLITGIVRGDIYWILGSFVDFAVGNFYRGFILVPFLMDNNRYYVKDGWKISVETSPK